MAARRKTGPSALTGSTEAKQKLSVMLEALAGLASTSEAAERMAVSQARYYQLELRALQGMMSALEPRARGRQNSPQRAISALGAEKKALEVELRRCQALLRAATRSAGVKVSPKRADSKEKKGRRTRRQPRAATVLSTLREQVDMEKGDGSQERAATPDQAPRGE